MPRAAILFRAAVLCTVLTLVAACGGGSSGSSPGVTIYDVSATAGAGGTISPATATVAAGNTTQLTVTPNSGYAVSGVTGCGGTLSGSTYTTGAVNADCTVTASFVARYTAAATAGHGGTISPSSALVNPGGATAFTVTPNSGYVISDVTGCGGSLSGSTYTTGIVNANCAVTASFSAALAWVSGSNTADAAAVYGTQGVTAATNMPGAREGGGIWTDASGNVWLFGGYVRYGSTSSTPASVLNDLWRYTPASGEWTWVGGSSSANSSGNYGTQGVAAPANMPPGRGYGASWVDGSGNFWMFGGFGYDATGTAGSFDDLWKYSPASGQWTWLGGSTTVNGTGSYGTQGVASPNNLPPPRNSAASWTDANGNVWLFGGAAWISAAHASFPVNDLWEYSPATGEWTWVGGSSFFNEKGIYGTPGVAAAANVPGSRYNAVSWTDASGNLWLFGGFGYDSAGNIGSMNDLWKYSPATGMWTWVAGADTGNAKGIYGAQGAASAANAPGARSLATGWTDANGNLWLFAGYGDDSTGTLGYLNDLWEYSPASGWAWIGGADTFGASGVYGTQSVAASSNIPGARGGIVSATDRGGNVWVFGGYWDSGGTRYDMNDLWKFPDE